MPVSYSYCKLLKLNLSYKVTNRSNLYKYHVKVNNPSYNIYSNDPFLLYKVLNEKKRLNAEKKDTLLKLFHLEI